MNRAHDFGIKIMVLYLLMVLLPRVLCERLPIDTTAEIVTGLQDRFNSGCVLLLYTQDYQRFLELGHGLVRLMKLLHLKELGTAALSSYSGNVHMNCWRNMPLHVLLNNDNYTQQTLTKITSEHSLSFARWLLLLQPGVRLQDFFRSIYVPFDCQFVVAQKQTTDTIVGLTEVYRVDRALPLRSTVLGTWSRDRGFQLRVNILSFLHKRRTDLHNITLKVAAVDLPPFSSLWTAADGTLQASGFFATLWNTLASRINCSTEFRTPEDNAYGAPSKDGWSGMVGQAVRQEVDVVASDISMTIERVDVVDFTIPVLSSDVVMFVRYYTDPDLHWTVFLGPFSTGVWLSIAAAIPIIAVFLALLHHFGRYLGNAEARGPERYRLYDSLMYVFGIFCMQELAMSAYRQLYVDEKGIKELLDIPLDNDADKDIESDGHDITPRAWSCRLLYLLTYLGALVLFAAYSAALISSLTVQRFDPPFDSFKQLLQDGSFSVGIISNTSAISYFEHTSNPIMIKIYELLLQPQITSMPNNRLEGFLRVCAQHKYVFMAPRESAGIFDADLPCEVTPLLGTYLRETLAMALTKGNPYRELINYHLREFKRTGLVKRMYKREWPQKMSSIKGVTMKVCFVDVAPILAVLASAIFVALVFLCIERREKHRYSQVRRRHRHVRLINRNKLLTDQSRTRLKLQ